MNQRFFIFKLKQLKGIGNKGLLRLLSFYLDFPNGAHSAENYLKIGKVNKKYKDIFLDSYKQIENIHFDDYLSFTELYPFVTIMEDEYPECLREIYNPPIAFFYFGDITLLNHPKNLAVIGSREATSFGKKMMDQMIPSICKENIQIVSGLAKGNDTFAHQAAIRSKGKTIAVIGSGLNVCYPKDNFRLQTFIGKEHLLISEYLPDTAPLRHHFPSRNRIIAGVSRGTCVIEAKKKSGTFITAQLALEEGRDVFSVPGNPLSDASEGCLQLIQDGAKCIWKAEDILEDWL